MRPAVGDVVGGVRVSLGNKAGRVSAGVVCSGVGGSTSMC